MGIDFVTVAGDWFNRVETVSDPRNKWRVSGLLRGSTERLVRLFPTLKTNGPNNEHMLEQQRSAALRYVVENGIFATRRDNFVRTIGIGWIGYSLINAASLGSSLLIFALGTLASCVMFVRDACRSQAKEHAAAYYKSDISITPDFMEWGLSVIQTPDHPSYKALNTYKNCSLKALVATIGIFGACVMVNSTMRDKQNPAPQPVKQQDSGPNDKQTVKPSTVGLLLDRALVRARG